MQQEAAPEALRLSGLQRMPRCTRCHIVCTSLVSFAWIFFRSRRSPRRVLHQGTAPAMPGAGFSGFDLVLLLLFVVMEYLMKTRPHHVLAALPRRSRSRFALFCCCDRAFVTRPMNSFIFNSEGGRRGIQHAVSRTPWPAPANDDEIRPAGKLRSSFHRRACAGLFRTASAARPRNRSLRESRGQPDLPSFNKDTKKAGVRCAESLKGEDAGCT